MSTQWTVPCDILRDVLFHLNRNEIEKCQWISIFWRNSIDFMNKFLPLRDFNSFDLMLRGDRAFLMKDTSKIQNKLGRSSYAISTYEEIKSFRYCWITNMRIHEFDEKLMETFKRIREMFGEKIRVKNFSILGPFASMTLINSLPTLFEEYVYALNFNLTLRYEELIYVSINPEGLRLPSQPEIFSLIDSHGNTAMYSPDSEDALNVGALCKSLCDPDVKSTNRKKALFSRMYKNNVFDMHICREYVEMFEQSTNPGTFFKMVEIWTSISTVMTTRAFLLSKNAKFSIMPDSSMEPKTEESETYETFTLAREDGWILRVMVDDTRYCLLKFWVVHEKET